MEFQNYQRVSLCYKEKDDIKTIFRKFVSWLNINFTPSDYGHGQWYDSEKRYYNSSEIYGYYSTRCIAPYINKSKIDHSNIQEWETFDSEVKAICIGGTIDICQNYRPCRHDDKWLDYWFDKEGYLVESKDIASEYYYQEQKKYKNI